MPARQAPSGAATYVRPVGETPDAYPERFDCVKNHRTLRIGAGEFAPVRPEVWQFSVSGFQVLRSWLAYRMRDGAGRKSSPLDDIRPQRRTAQFTRELLELLCGDWKPRSRITRNSNELLADATAGPTFTAAELPTADGCQATIKRLQDRPGRPADAAGRMNRLGLG